ncbi:MAG TPA: EsaB/YukD family protein [Candidatus Dormibacteraeota bacterium]
MTIVVTVESPRGRLTVRTPEDVPVEQLLPALLDAVGCEHGSGRWSLVPRGGEPLGRERTLRQSGVYQGAILQLRAEDPEAAMASAEPRAPWAEVASLQLRRAGGWALRAGGQAGLAVTKEAGTGVRNRRRLSTTDEDGGIAGAVTKPGLVIAVLAEEQGAGATTVTALLATLLARLRQAPVTAVDTEGPSGRLSLYLTAPEPQPGPYSLSPAAHPTAGIRSQGRLRSGPDGLRLRQLSEQPEFGEEGVVVVDCGLPGSLGARATLARADLCVAVSRAPGGPTSWKDRTAAEGRRPGQRLGAVVNRARRPALGRPRRDTPAAAGGKVSLTYEPAAASRLRAGAFSWDDAPRSWHADVRALADALLVERE